MLVLHLFNQALYVQIVHCASHMVSSYFLECTLYGTDMHLWTSVKWWLANINAATLLISEQTCVKKVTNQKLKVPYGPCNVNRCKNTGGFIKSSIYI